MGKFTDFLKERNKVARPSEPVIESYEAQNTLVKNWLESGHTLTAIQAEDMWDCHRLAARICDLRKDGMNIITRKEFSKDKKLIRGKVRTIVTPYAVYYLGEDKND